MLDLAPRWRSRERAGGADPFSRLDTGGPSGRPPDGLRAVGRLRRGQRRDRAGARRRRPRGRRTAPGMLRCALGPRGPREGVATLHRAPAPELRRDGDDRRQRVGLRLAPEGPRRACARPHRGARGRRPPSLHPLELTVAYQDSCHLRHAQRLPAAWLPLLERIPGLRVVEPAEQDLCCGSAGIYNVVQADAARDLGDRKAAHVLAAEPDAYASANPGCLVQVAQALGRAGKPLPALHPVELLDASIRGIPARELLAGARR